MPLYEYRCKSCGATFEVRQKFSDAPLSIHPECGGEAERLISVPALQFKGTGWYVTDYARKHTGSPANGRESASKPEAAAKPSETPATKAEPASPSKS